jgi:hypothetical protein
MPSGIDLQSQALCGEDNQPIASWFLPGSSSTSPAEMKDVKDQSRPSI